MKKLILHTLFWTALLFFSIVYNENNYIRQAVIVLSFAAYAYILLFRIYKRKIKFVFKTILNITGNFTRKIYNKLKSTFKISGSKKRTVKGSDEKRIVLSFREKTNSHRRKKLKGKSFLSNNDKIRYYYIKLILTLIKNDYAFKYSHTPNEIKKTSGKTGAGLLFNLYEQVRYYGDYTDIPDKTADEMSENYGK